MNRTEIRTRDGLCPIYVAHPAGSGPSPAVLVFMVGIGMGQAMLETERLAGSGVHAVALTRSVPASHRREVGLG
jgi:dienelactone hydrolase